jgi:hydrogenase expression/formation protein HypE
MSSERIIGIGACPLPAKEKERILLGHGSGGRLTAELIEKLFVPAFDNAALKELDDQAVLAIGGGARLAFTTDSYVVSPIFFPGGDIGELAVNGTINDLAVGGARPLALSLALILEEGLALDDLARVVESVRRAAGRAGVAIVTGDTKVVDRGSADRIFINTAGVGLVREGLTLGSARIRPGDRILVSGTMGDHGIAILARREGLELGGDVRSDTAPLHDLVSAILDACPDVHAMRDPTRGGLAAVLHEIATRRDLGVSIDESSVPVSDVVRGASELLGLDPLFVANEGKLVAFVPEHGADHVLAAMRAHPLGERASLIGVVTEEHRGLVRSVTAVGGERLLDLPLGESLPRIC